MDPKLSIKGSGYTKFQNRFTLLDIYITFLVSGFLSPFQMQAIGAGGKNFRCRYCLLSQNTTSVYLPCQTIPRLLDSLCFCLFSNKTKMTTWMHNSQ